MRDGYAYCHENGFSAEVAPMDRLHFVTSLLVLLAILTSGLAGANTAYSQSIGQGSGESSLSDWPADLEEARRNIRTELQLLPKLDQLDLSYRYQVGEEGVDFSFVLAWRPGREALYQGRIVRYRSLPDGVRMTAIELEADVHVDGERVARMLIGVDSMALAPDPSVYSFEVPSVAYEQVFLETSAEEARRFLREGVSLRNLHISRVAFGVPRSQRQEQDYRREDSRQSSSSWSIYAPRVNVILGWRIGPRPYYIDRRPDPRTWQPRGATVGRTGATTDRTRSETGRGSDERSETDDSSDRGEATTGRGKNTSRGDDDDEDDEDSLLPAGAVALAGVGLAAIIGGTVGYSGTGKTPIGLMAGWVRPRGGTLLQASINSAVLDDNGGREHLVVQGWGFYDVFRAPIQPAIGLGVLATAEGSETTVEAGVSIGAALNLGRVIVTGGYDVVQQNAEFGLAINFKYKRDAR